MNLRRQLVFVCVLTGAFCANRGAAVAGSAVARTISPLIARNNSSNNNVYRNELKNKTESGSRSGENGEDHEG